MNRSKTTLPKALTVSRRGPVQLAQCNVTGHAVAGQCSAVPSERVVRRMCCFESNRMRRSTVGGSACLDRASVPRGSYAVVNGRWRERATMIDGGDAAIAAAVPEKDANEGLW
jgi:hypothetical protein